MSRKLLWAINSNRDLFGNDYMGVYHLLKSALSIEACQLIDKSNIGINPLAVLIKETLNEKKSDNEIEDILLKKIKERDG